MFQGIENAQMTKGGNWIQPGKFVLMVDFLKTHLNAIKRGEQFITEFFVLYSTNPSQPAGSKVSWCASSWHPSAAGNIKAFFVALMQCKPEQINEQGCNMATSPQQPCQGRLIMAEAYNKKTRSNTDFTAVNWGPVDSTWTQRAAELVQTLGISLTPKEQLNQPAQNFGAPQGYPQQPAAPQGFPPPPMAPQGYPQQPAAPQGFGQPAGFGAPQAAPQGFGPPAGFPPPDGQRVPF